MRRLLSLSLLVPLPLLAAHPLITEDTGTQGAGRWQLELAVEHGIDQAENEEVHDTESAVTLSYGVTDALDAVLTWGYQRFSLRGGDAAVGEGDGDVGIDLKWRYYENGRLSLAVKPGTTLPTGDEEDGMSAGKATYSVYSVTTYAPDPWAFHLHVGYIRDNNNADLRENRGHLSFAAARAFSGFTAVADVGITTNPDPAVHDPAFLILGAIVPLLEGVDVDLGVKVGLNEAETDEALLAGIAVRF